MDTVRGWAGYWLDLCALATGRFKNPRSYMKFRVLRALARELHADELIETGTFKGTMAARASKVFKKVTTIELDPVLARAARERLARFGNVELIEGDAVETIGNALERTGSGGAVVFLDAHYSGGPTAKGELPEPAIKELERIRPYASKVRAIVIDDYRSFGVEPGFPTQDELMRSARALFAPAGFEVNVFRDMVIIRGAAQ